MNSTSLSVSWQPVNDSTVKYYTVYYASANPITFQMISFPNSSTSVTIVGLDSKTEYVLMVSVTFEINGMEYEGERNNTVQLYLEGIVRESSVNNNDLITATLSSPSNSMSTEVIIHTSSVSSGGGSQDSSSSNSGFLIGSIVAAIVFIAILNVMCLVLGTILILKRRSKAFVIIR